MPTKPDIRPLNKGTLSILNAIRSNASLEYQDRIPLATQNNIRDVGNAMMSFTATQNEFLNALVNRIGMVIIQNKLYTNRLAEFKQGLLEYGETVEEIFTNIANAHPFNPDVAEREVFKREIPDVNAIFHRLNYQNFYKATVTREILSHAFLSVSGVTDMISQIVQSLTNGANFDEFIQTKRLMRDYADQGLYYPVYIPAVVDEPTARTALVAIRKTINDLTFMATQYNAMHVTTFSEKRDLIFFCTTKFDALVSVEALAYAFHMEKAEVESRKIVLDDFGGIQNAECIICDREWFKIFDVLLQMDEIRNPQGLYWNYFLHRHIIFSVSPFSNAVLFTTVQPSVTSVQIVTNATQAERGKFIELDSVVTTVGNAPQTVTWEFTEAVHAGTRIDFNGTVWVDPAEYNTQLYIRVRSTFDPSKEDSIIIPVV